MKIEKITYQKAFPIGPFLQEKLGLEIILDGTDPEYAYSEARKIVDAWHKENNPHLEGMTITYGPEIQPERMDEPQEIQLERPSDVKTALIQDIMSCNEVKVLESYKLLVKSQPELQAAYDKRMEELLNQLIK